MTDNNNRIEDIKAFLIEKVLLPDADTQTDLTEKKLISIRREKPDYPVISVSSGTSSIISGSERTVAAIESYINENTPAARMIRVGCTGPANFEPLVCIQLPGRNRLFFRNITEEKVEPLLNGVFHNDINEEDL
ncbi:MAG TPA: hypothetical protein VJ963_03465 [Bacteroidales bacterium]|nr:hypothetical protein [Bacteroidales bacterium]